jgi:hypothetical protein
VPLVMPAPSLPAKPRNEKLINRDSTKMRRIRGTSGAAADLTGQRSCIGSSKGRSNPTGPSLCNDNACCRLRFSRRPCTRPQDHYSPRCQDVSVSGASQPNLRPDNTAYGNCGKSWLYLSPGTLKFYYHTGFAVNSPAYDYHWVVHLYGPNFWEQSRTWNGAMSGTVKRFPSSGDYTVVVDDTGYYRGAVDTGSYAILDNGNVCYSGGPTSTTFVSGPHHRALATG